MTANSSNSPANAAQTATGRVAFVTGGAMGIGEAIVRRLAADGYLAIVADRDTKAAAALVRAMEADGLRAVAMTVDVGSEASITSVFDQLERDYGRCDVLVNNAGIAQTFPFWDYPADHWRAVLDVNLTGPMLLGQRAARLMMAARWGRIVNIASISGLRASAGRTAYGTSKAAIVGLTRQMAIELAPFGITANGVAPGPVDTPLVAAVHTQDTRDSFLRAIPMQRYGRPDEIAAAVSFLASSDASFITGHTIPVDGGFMAAGILEI